MTSILLKCWQCRCGAGRGADIVGRNVTIGPFDTATDRNRLRERALLRPYGALEVSFWAARNAKVWRAVNKRRVLSRQTY